MAVAIRRFSVTERFRNTPLPSGKWTSPACRMADGEALVMSLPSRRTRPDAGRTRPLMARARLLFPAPLGPRMAKVPPDRRANEASETATAWP